MPGVIKMSVLTAAMLLQIYLDADITTDNIGTKEDKEIERS